MARGQSTVGLPEPLRSLDSRLRALETATYILSSEQYPLRSAQVLKSLLPNAGVLYVNDGTLRIAVAADISALLDADLVTIAGLSVARGALLVGSSAPAWSILTLGTAGQIPISNGTDLVYRALLAADIPALDHGSALTGLADDDHPQYAQVAAAETISAIWTVNNLGAGLIKFALDPSDGLGGGVIDVWAWLMDMGSSRYLELRLAALAANGAATFPAGTYVLVGDTLTQTLTNKTLTTPTITSFVNATHNHSGATGGGTLNANAIAAGLLALARGGTNADLSATGGSGQVLKQASAGAAITVGAVAFADLSSKPTTLAGYGITDAQGLDATLTALAGLDTSTGAVEQTGTDTFAKREITAPASSSAILPATGDEEITAFGATLSADGKLGKVNLTNYDVSGGTTATQLARAPAAGLYHLHMYGVVRSTLSGTLTVTLRWTDNYGAQSIAVTIAATAGTVGSWANANRAIYVASGSVTIEGAGAVTGNLDLFARITALP